MFCVQFLRYLMFVLAKGTAMLADHPGQIHLSLFTAGVVHTQVMPRVIEHAVEGPRES